MVRYEFDPANPPPLTSSQKAEISALVARPDGEIDTSDIPPLDEKYWKNAVRKALRDRVLRQESRPD
jgi:hypothetical protein